MLIDKRGSSIGKQPHSSNEEKGSSHCENNLQFVKKIHLLNFYFFKFGRRFLTILLVPLENKNLNTPE